MSDPKLTDYYCSQKFWWLSVDLGKFQTSSCCAATPQRPNINWLKQNPGQLFNTPELVSDRQSMLDSGALISCKDNCWIPESQGLPSRRSSMGSQDRTHLKLINDPEVLNIVIGSDCNMTCVYCCKTHSSAWSRDVATKGYPVTIASDRFTINDRDRLVSSVGQKQLKLSSVWQTVLDETIKLYQAPGLREISITGGEPFLYLDLARLVANIPDHISVSICSGLGVDETRFAKELEKLPNNITIAISAENIGPAYEFVRYGNSWKRFNTNLDQLKLQKIAYKFSSTVSNLTVPGLPDFVDWAQDAHISFNLCNDPDFLSVAVLDANTKKLLHSKLNKVPDFVLEAMDHQPSDQQIHNFRAYVKEFGRRRSLTTAVFPKTLADWIEQ